MSATNTLMLLRREIEKRKPQLPPAPMIDRAADASAARIAGQRAKAFASGAEGRQSTLLTGPSGLPSDAPTKRKTLLGL